MLNFRLLYSLINSKYLHVLLGWICVLGFTVLVDILILLKIVSFLGTWMTLALLALGTTISIPIIYRLIEYRHATLIASIEAGKPDERLFFEYISAILSCFFLITPGLINKFIGGALLLPPVSRKIGAITLKITGIDWSESYEYLRLENLFVEESIEPTPLQEET